MNKRFEIRKTSDGSNTIFLPDLNENYHSHHGAIQEAKHVFIKNGLDEFSSKHKISIFELGFGTGLNAFLACLWAEKNKITIKYSGIEAFPVPIETCKQMNFSSQFEPNSLGIYTNLIESKWGEPCQISPHFTIQKIQHAIQNWSSEEKFDLIFFDAFGPRAQPEMWDLPILEKMFDFLDDRGVLVTYCAKGQLKRNLKSLGFIVESLPGPPGKREMTRARRN